MLAFGFNMRPLNGWQRLWVVLMVPLGAATTLLTYSSLPSSVYLAAHPRPSSRVLSAMATPAWEGSDCVAVKEFDLPRGRKIVGSNERTVQVGDTVPKELMRSGKYQDAEQLQILQAMIEAGETDENLQIVANHFAAGNMIKVEVPLEGYEEHAVLCFAANVPMSRLEALAREYQTVYARALASERVQMVGWATAFYIFAGGSSYLLGWSIAWVRRGFSARQQ